MKENKRIEKRMASENKTFQKMKIIITNNQINVGFIFLCVIPLTEKHYLLLLSLPLFFSKAPRHVLSPSKLPANGIGVSFRFPKII
jgi:hypothetical protein